MTERKAGDITVGEICRALELEVVCAGDATRKVGGAIVGDLLSHILGEARENWLWVTIQVHMNVSAVASLRDLPLVILASGRKPQEDLAKKCAEENLALAVSPLRAYELCARLHALGVGDAATD